MEPIDERAAIKRLILAFGSSKTPTSVSHRKFVTVMSLVPAGFVATYGQIAKLSGRPGHARQVVWTLHSSSRKYRIPWHRIINSQGKIGLADEASRQRQLTLLQREGIIWGPAGKVDLKIFQWRPSVPRLKRLLKKIESI